MANDHDFRSASSPDTGSNDTSRSLFARLPRPQRVLQPLVPDAAVVDSQTSRPPQPSLAATLLPLRPPPTAFIQNQDHARSIPTFAKPLTPARKIANIKDTGKEVEDSVPTIVLGYHTQDTVKWTIFAKKERSGVVMFMVKPLELQVGKHVKELLEHIHHDNIAKVIQVSQEEDRVLLGIEYCGVTLKEILHVRKKLEEPEIRYIAFSVFNAMSYLARHGIAHHSIRAQSIRVVMDDYRIVLSKFQIIVDMYVTDDYCQPISSQRVCIRLRILSVQTLQIMLLMQTLQISALFSWIAWKDENYQQRRGKLSG